MIRDHETSVTIVMVVGLVIVALGIWIGQSHFEAKAYNNITGSNVSTWDAMFIELRVQDTPPK